MSLNREQIAALIPHGSAMCMLDEVVAWDSEQIHCRSTGFASPDNPLFERDQLPSVLLIEYAAQAAAIHSALLAPATEVARSAYIGAVKQLELVKPLSDNQAAIDIEAICLLNNNGGAIYAVVAQQRGEVLMRSQLILNKI